MPEIRKKLQEFAQSRVRQGKSRFLILLAVQLLYCLYLGRSAAEHRSPRSKQQAAQKFAEMKQKSASLPKDLNVCPVLSHFSVYGYCKLHFIIGATFSKSPAL